MYSMKPVELAGQTFGRLTAIRRIGTKHGHAEWLCNCSCGRTVNQSANELRSGKVRTCGCAKTERCKTGNMTRTHGQTGTPTWKSWMAMRQRCTVKGHTAYPRYGGSGITVCARWIHSFENFLADMHERPTGTELGRFGDIGNYEVSNCKWMTRKEQCANRKPKKR
jgi:hypothetical protein